MRHWSENQVRLVWIRHGATRANKERRYLGKTDESLSPDGIEALQKAKYAGLYPEISCLFSGPMKRCVETAEILYPGKEPVLISEWEEINFGIFEGKSYGELQGDSRYQAWIDSNGSLPFPGGESREEFIRRCKRGFVRMLTTLSEIPKKDGRCGIAAGMIVHGGTIMSLLSCYCGGEYFDYQIANGEGYCCRAECSDGNIRFTELERLKV
ncbi:MAG: histidine phosphatase family protein [Lachnospira sp.]|nr:histidine phosphatase family protein [Lachnospira sp.]